MILLWDPLSGWSVLHLGGVLHLWRMLRHPQKAYGLRGLPVRMFGQTKKNICSDNDYHNLDAPCMEYLPTFTPKMQSFVGKYSSTMEHLGNDDEDCMVTCSMGMGDFNGFHILCNFERTVWLRYGICFHRVWECVTYINPKRNRICGMVNWDGRFNSILCKQRTHCGINTCSKGVEDL